MEQLISFTSDNINHLPQTPGIYKFFDIKGKLLYIGKAKNLKKRVASYFYHQSNLDSKTFNLIKKIYSIFVIEVQSEFEAILLEAKLIKKYQPKYNLICKDDKHYIYIRITNEEFPKVFYSRKENEGEVILFGPFPSVRIVREILTLIRSIIPFCSQKENINKRCFYSHLGLCNPCPADIKKTSGQEYKIKSKEYLKNIRQIKTFLSGNINQIRKYLYALMFQAANKNKFEEAAIFRKKLQNLHYLLKSYHPLEEYIQNPDLIAGIKEKESHELALILRKYFNNISQVNKIECYDISNLSGKWATGSMITFVNGDPDKSRYRRFKIKSTDQPNDFAALSEVVRRRLRHKEWSLPDLWVIDGGKPQLTALKKILSQTELNIPMIGLAKKEEEFVIPHNNTYDKIKLPPASPALHLIMRVRDEAHRFAHKYHTYLRLKYLIGSVEKKKAV